MGNGEWGLGNGDWVGATLVVAQLQNSEFSIQILLLAH
jgi:hypothetical protein